jgi:hypothetical protein
MLISPVNDFHPFRAALHEKLDNSPLLDFRDK